MKLLFGKRYPLTLIKSILFSFLFKNELLEILIQSVFTVAQSTISGPTEWVLKWGGGGGGGGRRLK